MEGPPGFERESNSTLERTLPLSLVFRRFDARQLASVTLTCKLFAKVAQTITEERQSDISGGLENVEVSCRNDVYVNFGLRVFRTYRTTFFFF